jgi:MGT family glycosyltransferase
VSTVAVFLDLDEGHSHSIFQLLRRLEERGHRICCLGLPLAGHSAREQGFEFITIIEDILPKDLLHSERFRDNYIQDGLRDIYFGPLVRGEVLDRLMAELRPDVGVFHCHYYPESLVARFRYGLPIVYFVPQLRTASRAEASEAVIETLMNLKSGAAEMLDLLASAGVSIRSLKDVAQLVLQAPELTVLPEAFDLPERSKEAGVYHVGFGVDLERAEESFDWEGIDPDRPLIFCSLGSQNYLTLETSRKFFQTVIATGAMHPRLQFVVSIGQMLGVSDFGEIPGNMKLRNWVPQMDVLSRASLMINHGGFGTIKECILKGVPMLVLPLRPDRDQDATADRVTHHGLGLKGDIDRITPGELGSMIERVVGDDSYRRRVAAMREKFRQEGGLETGVEVVERVIAESSGTRRGGAS